MNKVPKKDARVLTADRQAQKIENSRLRETYLRSHPCVDCGTTDRHLLTFDHRYPALKVLEVSTLVALGFPLDTVKQEIAKCDVRCVQCHRKRHATPEDKEARLAALLEELRERFHQPSVIKHPIRRQ